MAIYQAVSGQNIGYFTKFKDAEDFLEKEPNFEEEDNIYLLTVKEETGCFIKDSSTHIFDDYIPLRDLTVKELNQLPSKLYTIHNSPNIVPDVYISEEALLKNYDSYYELYRNLFGQFGSLRETYALHVMFDKSIRYILADTSFRDALRRLRIYQEENSIKEVEVNSPGSSRIIDYISLTTEDKLRTALQMAEDYVETLYKES